MTERLAILDAGAQYGKSIDRWVRELSVESVFLPLSTSASELADYQALIISGGPASVYGQDAPEYDHRIFSLGKPILGICYGMQLMIHALRGEVTKPNRREDGPCEIIVDPNSPLFQGLATQQEVLMSHGDSVTNLAPKFRVIARSGEIIAGIENPEDRLSDHSAD